MGFQTSTEGEEASPTRGTSSDATSTEGHRGLQHARCTVDSGAQHCADTTASDNVLSTQCNTDRSRLRPADD